MMDEVTFLIRLLSDRWDAAVTSLGSQLPTNHRPLSTGPSDSIKILDIRSLEPKEGRRVDVDSHSVLLVFEDGMSQTNPTIDTVVRNETFNMTIHMRVLHRRDFASLTDSRDRLQSIFRITRYILENNARSPTVYQGSGTSGTVEDSAELITFTGRSEANDRGKRLLGYKLSVEIKRFGRSTV